MKELGEVGVGPAGVTQVNGAIPTPLTLGGVMVKVIAPVGWAAPIVAAPVTMAVSTLVPLSVGLAEEVRVIAGAWALK